MVDERNKEPEKDFWKVVLIMFATTLLTILFLCTACGSTKNLAGENRDEVKHDTTKIYVRDSVHSYDRDSIFVKEKGDTIFKYVEKWRWRDRWHTDTVIRIRVDSVAVERTVEVQVEKPLSWWQKARIGAFWYLLGAVVLLLLWVFRKPLLKLIRIAI